MIELSREQWFGLSETLLDDSAGAVSVPWTWSWDEDTDIITIDFVDAREETLFLLQHGNKY